MTTAIILAGGLGTRLRSVIKDCPKPMALIQGRPFLEYQMNYWIEQGITHLILSVGYKKEVIINHFGHRFKGITISYATENTPLGTGGGLILAASELKQPFLVLNGDTFFEVDLKKLISFHNEVKSDWTLALNRTEETHRYMGVSLTSENQIISFKSNAVEHFSLVNGGVYWVEPLVLSELIASQEQRFSLEDDLLPYLKEQGKRFYGLEFFGKFIDIGIPSDYYRAQEILKQDLNENV